MDDLDHRSLGQALDLFHFDDDAPGSVFWHPRGFALYHAVEEHMRRRVRADGYREVRSPVLMARDLWERSGHWDLYGPNMFVVDGDGSRPFAVKPMNCPGHVEIFRHGVRSWRDLPLRLAEFGQCHRDEPSGALHGLLRLRGFVQDDGHVFCREDQVEDEVARFCALLKSAYADFGFADFNVGISLRPDVRLGSDAQWDRAETMLALAASKAGLHPAAMPGEGAFYGPKLEFALTDLRGRAWQCGTMQLDLVLPERLGASYRDADDRKVAPIMLHRAVLGSIERFVGIMLEQHDGRLPDWLAPEQAVVVPIGSRHAGYAASVARDLEAAGVRVRPDDGMGRMASRVKDAVLMRVPRIFVIGDREMEDASVSVRAVDGSLSSVPVAQAVMEASRASAPPS